MGMLLEPEHAILRQLIGLHNAWCILAGSGGNKSARAAAAERWACAGEILLVCGRQLDRLDNRHMAVELSRVLVRFLLCLVGRRPAELLEHGPRIRQAYCELLATARRLSRVMPEAATVLSSWSDLVEAWRSGKVADVDDPATLAGAFCRALAGTPAAIAETAQQARG